MMFAVGTTVLPFQCIINWAPEYYYAHSIPDDVTIREGAHSNEMHLFYWNGDIHASKNPIITVYFVDKDGYLLDLRYVATDQSPPNPASIMMYPVAQGNQGYVYIRYLT
ncbi:MAG: hypothetical protein LUE93_14440, partial [Bacteroides sp.]|nr:hypothetical protein [Bacteroides sp.]